MRSRLHTFVEPISLAFLAGISLLGGVVKVALYSGEVVLYKSVGFTISQIVVFGVFQLLGGLLLLPSSTRSWGALLSTLTFAISTGLAIINNFANIALALGGVVFIGSYVTYREFFGRGRVSD